MFSSIFRKQLCVYIGTFVIIFLAFGIAMSQVLSGYFVNKQKQTLVSQAKKISMLYSDAYVKWVKTGVMDKIRIQTELTWMEEALGIRYVIIDSELNAQMYSEDLFNELLNQNVKITLPQIKELNKGEIIYLEGDLGGAYKGDFITVGCPIIFGQQKVVGAILMNASVPGIQREISNVLNRTFALMALALVIAFILVYISSKTISKPLLEINDAAKVISDGNFEKRIDIKSRDEVGQLAESFNLMAESLEKQEIQRRDFISNVSHDLRSPLTSINGFLQAILDGTIEKEDQNRYIGIIMDETTRLAKLANDILDINKLNMLELNKSIFNINELIRETIIKFENRVTEKNIDIDISFADEKNFVEADYEKIQRVVYNLMDNAIKFTNENGKIEIKTYLENEKIFVSVKDSGIGISEEDKKRVFDRFFKVDSSRGKDRKGSGLGLSIIKEFVKAHNETLIFKSEIGKGTEFIFSLQTKEKI